MMHTTIAPISRRGARIGHCEFGRSIEIVNILFHWECHWQDVTWNVIGPSSGFEYSICFVCPVICFGLDRSDLPRSKYRTKPLAPGNDSSTSHWVITIFTIYDIYIYI